MVWYVHPPAFLVVYRFIADINVMRRYPCDEPISIYRPYDMIWYGMFMPRHFQWGGVVHLKVPADMQFHRFLILMNPEHIVKAK